MKTNGLRRLLLAVGLFTLAAMPAAALSQDAPLKVSRILLRTREYHYSFTGAQSSGRLERNAVDRRKGNLIYSPHLAVRNTTSKTVVKVRWEVVLYRDINRDEVLRTYDYATRREIRPGQNVELRGGDLAYPTADFTYPYEGKIVEVTYSDGTVWSRS